MRCRFGGVALLERAPCGRITGKRGVAFLTATKSQEVVLVVVDVMGAVRFFKPPGRTPGACRAAQSRNERPVFAAQAWHGEARGQVRPPALATCHHARLTPSCASVAREQGCFECVPAAAVCAFLRKVHRFKPYWACLLLLGLMRNSQARPCTIAKRRGREAWQQRW